MVEAENEIDWETVVRDDGPAAWNAACRILGNAEDARDCVQEALTGMVNRARREPIRFCRALLVSMVTARAIDHLRRRADRKAVTLTAPHEIPGTQRQPLAALEAAELAERLRDAIGRLSPQQARVFVLHCVEDWSYQEIAAELSLSSGAVGMTLTRARERLRELLTMPSATGPVERERGEQ